MLRYLNKIEELCFKNKYTKVYVNIIKLGIGRCEHNKPIPYKKEMAFKLLGYAEGHHIIPVSICDVNEKRDTLNIVYLKAREHFLCHWLLIKMFKDTPTINKMKAAFCMMRIIQIFFKTKAKKRRHNKK
jgi:hypothetical protein